MNKFVLMLIEIVLKTKFIKKAQNKSCLKSTNLFVVKPSKEEQNAFKLDNFKNKNWENNLNYIFNKHILSKNKDLRFYRFLYLNKCI